MIKQPDFFSKSISLICVFLFVILLSISAYLVSTLKGKIDDTEFTISQSLAFSEKFSLVSLLVVAFSILSYLIYYRGHKYLLFRLFLNLVICAFIITIVWVTTFYSKLDHYILAGIIFISVLVSILLDSYLLYNGLKIKTKQNKIILMSIPILAILGLIVLFIAKLKVVEDKVVQLFPIFENYMIVIKGLSIISLGFI